MKLRLTFLASIAIVISLALVGVFRDVNLTQAKKDNPVQPFAALSTGGISNTKLGQRIESNYTQTQINWGERVTLPWIYSGAGFQIYDGDAIGASVGSVWSAVDVFCDGTVNYMQLKDTCANPAEDNPLVWKKAGLEATLAGTNEQYLLKIMPPFPWLLRHKAVIQTVCVGTGSVDAPSVLNTVYASIPFSPTVNGKQAFVAQTQLGGSPDTPPSKVCLDSPQDSTSITEVYQNPPLKGTSHNGLDDASGLYPRWTIFQSKGSSSLNLGGDLRKPYQSPPSIPSDTGYVERIVQLECFWIDDLGCATCDDDAKGYITPEESWNDPHLLTLTSSSTGAEAKAKIDKDGDCLMNSTYAQPGWPAVDLVDDPATATSCDSNANWVVYSEYPLVHHNTANDQDCDGLVDGVEWFWCGADCVTAAHGDFDGDGATDFVEMFQFTNPKAVDTDLDGFWDKPANVYGQNTDTSMDNCPTVKNGTGVGEDNQANSDGQLRPNGPKIPGDSANNPNQDKMGNACDVDNDNDNATDVYEQTQCTPGPEFSCPPATCECDTTPGVGTRPTATTCKLTACDPLRFDTDGDTVGDGYEIHAGSLAVPPGDPLDPGKKPVWDSTNDQIYYRGCQINVNHTGIFATAFEPYVTNGAGQETDPDGDGVTCPTDNDSDTALPGKKSEVPDKFEAMGYNTLIANADTDGDGCADWVEIFDFNGDRTVDSIDVGLMNKRAANKIAPDIVSDRIFDANKDGFIDSIDTGLMNKNNCTYKSGVGGCPTCPLHP
jgi:hypothetical protein